MEAKVKPLLSINLTVMVPGDKSVSHRAVMFGSIAKGITEINGFLTGEDCLSTIRCFRQLGVSIDISGTSVNVHGNGLNGLKPSANVLDVGNSGTTMRLLSGILAGMPFNSNLTGDSSIQKRPMGRVITPLNTMGGAISGKDGGLYAPLCIEGKKLKGINYKMPVASAQVKSAVLLAGLYANGPTTVTEPSATRNHTEKMLNAFGANIVSEKNTITCVPVNELYAQKITVPGDISSAAFLIVAGLILPNSRILLQNVGVNETRTGIITALQSMGANIKLQNLRQAGPEPIADILVTSSELKATTIEGDIIPKMIDEIPVFAVAALFAEGSTIVADAQELKVKESNRITAMVKELSKLGASVDEKQDGMVIHGKKPLKGARVNSHGDHRVAMSLAIAALNAEGETTIEGADCVDVSFPGFFELLI